MHTLASYAASMVAWLQLRAGAWDEAERAARAELGQATTVPRLLAETVVCELAVRRGDADAADRLADLVAKADRAAELQRIVPALALAIEWSLTRGGPLPLERLRRVIGEIDWDERPGCDATRAAAWAAVAGLDVPWAGSSSAPYAAMLRRDWAAAADAFGDVGWDYDRALMLSLTTTSRR